MPYMCSLCNEAEKATVLITPLSGGETMAIGAECMVTGLCGLLSVATETDPEKLYDALLGLAGKSGQDAPPAARKTRRRPPAAAAADSPPADAADADSGS